MMRRLPILLFLIALFGLMAAPAKASHIAGADLSYQCQGNGVYLVKLDLIRDCSGIAAPQSANVSAATTGCGTQQVTLTQTSSSFVEDFCWNIATTCFGGNNPGYQRIRYQGIITLPPSCGIADLSYSLCCRNNVATNIQNAGSNNLYVEAQINTAICNNGPNFGNPSSLIVCDGQATTLYVGGVDPDGDSLVYSLANPLGGANNPLQYQPGYSVLSPLTTTGGVSINSNTGELTFTPNGLQAGIIAINVKEYRNGQLVGQSNRDFVITVINCTGGNTPPFQSGGPSNLSGASLVGPNHISVCAGTALSFDVSFNDNDAVDSLGYTIPTQLPQGVTTSYTGWKPIDITVSWTPSVPGTYYIPVKVTDAGCDLRFDATSVIRIDVIDGTSAGPDQTICQAGASVQLQAIGGSSFSWSPSTGLSNPNIANPIANPSSTTTYIVTSNLTGGCTNTDTVTIYVNPSNISITAMNDTTYCSNDSVIYLQSTTNGVAALWTLNGQAIGTVPNWYTWNPGQPSTYIVTAYDTNGCTASDTVNIGVTSIFANVAATPETCSQSNGSALAVVTGGSAPYTYSWSNGSTSNPATGLSSATYSVVVTDAQGCEGFGYGYVQNIGVFLQAIFQNQGFCQGDSALVYLSGTVFGPRYSVSVSPNYNIDSVQPNSYFVYPDTTTRYVFTVSDTSGCSVSDTVLVNVQPALSIDLGGDTTLCGVNVLDMNATVSGGTGVGSYNWNAPFGTLDTNGTASNTVTVNQAGWVAVTYWDSNGCSATDFINIDLDSTCYSYLGGNVYADANGNCAMDAGDFGLANVMIEATDGNISIFDFTDPSGSYNFQVGNGSWDIIQHAPAYYSQICPASSHNVLISGPGTVNPSLHFYDTLQGVNDLRISNSIWVIRPGFQRWGTMYICNDGNTTANGYVNLINPPGVTMVWAPHPGSSNSIAPDTYNAASGLATWNFSNLAPGACFSIHYHYIGDTNLTIPQNLPFVAQVYPQSGDATPLNNIDVDSVPVSNSYDPNDKAVTPAGEGPNGEITIDQNTLQYRIRFQNTGNDTAYLVVLKDTLDVDLNMESIKLLASSHDYDARIDSNRVLTFTFNNINLPDSMTDPEGSQGFVMFEIGIDNPQIGTVVKNQAAIYFDFNPPIFTNTVTNTIVEKSVGFAGVERSQFEIFPNPTKGDVMVRSLDGEEIEAVHVYDLTGSLVSDVHPRGQSQVKLDLSDLSQGVYLIEVSSELGSSVERIVIE